MIFVGDIALPFKSSIDYSKIPNQLFSQNWIGNLEGAIIDNDSTTIRKGLYNDRRAIISLIKDFNFKALLLANNHITDVGSVEATIEFLSQYNIAASGAGSNLDLASKPIHVNEDKTDIVIHNFGWEAIQCNYATESSSGVNPLDKNWVISKLQHSIARYPKHKHIVYFHWSYELEEEPQPLERKLAHKLIELGVSGVFGAHSHRPGVVEYYNNKPILYGLGNWLLKHNYFYEGKLIYPDLCKNQLAVEWNFETNSLCIHHFKYDSKNSSIDYITSENFNQDYKGTLKNISGMSDDEYLSYYKENHYHKKKGLPIFNFEDSNILYKGKIYWLNIRALAVKFRDFLKTLI